MTQFDSGRPDKIHAHATITRMPGEPKPPKIEKPRTKELLPRLEQQEMTEERIVEVAKIALRWGEEYWSKELARVYPNREGFKTPPLVLYHDKIEVWSFGKDDPDVIKCDEGALFYAPDSKIYLDPAHLPTFYQKFGIKVTPLTVALLILHEFGHWVQKELRIVERYKSLTTDAIVIKKDMETAGALSNEFETQADFLAGACLKYVHDSKGILEKGDIEEAASSRELFVPKKATVLKRGVMRFQKALGTKFMVHSIGADRRQSTEEGLEKGDWVKRLLRDDNLLDVNVRSALRRASWETQTP
jgi:predicted metalloprotease